MLAKMSYRQLLRWLEYSQVEPFGEARADLRIAILTAHVMGLFVKRGHRRPQPADFMPRFKGPLEKTQRGAQNMGQRFKAFAQLHNRMLEQKRSQRRAKRRDT